MTLDSTFVTSLYVNPAKYTFDRIHWYLKHVLMYWHYLNFVSKCSYTNSQLKFIATNQCRSVFAINFAVWLFSNWNSNQDMGYDGYEKISLRSKWVMKSNSIYQFNENKHIMNYRWCAAIRAISAFRIEGWYRHLIKLPFIMLKFQRSILHFTNHL